MSPAIEIDRDRPSGWLGLSQKAVISSVARNQALACSFVRREIQWIQSVRLRRGKWERLPYASAVGSLMYLQTCKRPDIALTLEYWRNSFSYQVSGSFWIPFLLLFGYYYLIKKVVENDRKGRLPWCWTGGRWWVDTDTKKDLPARDLILPS